MPPARHDIDMSDLRLLPHGVPCYGQLTPFDPQCLPNKYCLYKHNAHVVILLKCGNNVLIP